MAKWGHSAMRRTRCRACGFSLVELVITVAIVAILATISMPLAQIVSQRSKEQDLRDALRQIREAIDNYKQLGDEGRITRKAGESGYPSSLTVLVDGVEDAKDPKKTLIYLLRRLPPDPMADDPALPAEETWGVRSYASPPTEPAPGADVYDVYSLSTRVGLNGIPYRDW